MATLHTASTQPTNSLDTAELPQASIDSESEGASGETANMSGGGPLSTTITSESEVSTPQTTNVLETDTSQGLYLISKLSGRSYHLVTEMKSWTEARDHCRRTFTDLASIPSPEEEEVITRFAAPGVWLWIGLYNDDKSPGGWKWTTGESFNYSNWAPWYTQEFNATFPVCVYIDVDQWMDTDCEIPLPFICYKDPLQQLIVPDSEVSTAKPANLTGTGLNQAQQLSGRGYHLINELQGWSEARDYCQSRYTDLANILSPEEWKDVTRFAIQGVGLWIGLYNDGGSSNGWKWTTGEMFNHANWVPWRPQELNTTFPSCVYIDSDQWMDTQCDVLLPFICYTELPVLSSAEEPETSSSQTTTILETDEDEFQTLEAFLANISSSGELPPFFNSDEEKDLTAQHRNVVKNDETQSQPLHPPKPRVSESEGRPLPSDGRDREYHVIKEEKTWKEARDYCRRNYTDLVSFRNPKEEQLVIPLLGQGEWKWIGLYNEELTNNGWKWTNGDDFTYSNWALWYPEQFSASSSPICVCTARDEWFDLQCDFTLPFICYTGYVQSIGTEERLYFLVDQLKNWSEARDYCQRHYTGLLSVRSQQESEILGPLLTQAKWIGLYSNGVGSWQWSNGDAYQYANWSPSYPSRYAAGLPVCAYASDKGWGEEKCESHFSFVCYLDRNQTITSRDRTYFLIEEEKTWNKAWSYCRNHYTNLASVRSAEEASLISVLVHGPQWIGLYTDGMSGWMWTNGDHFSYSKWGLWHPFNFNNSLPMCVAVFDGEWHEADCDFPFAFICYRDSASRRLYHKVNMERTWPDARDYCRAHYTDLLSIRNEQENNSTRALFSELKQGWCGLYNDRQRADSWEWADSSPVTYVHWKPGQPHRYSLLSPVCVYVEEGQWIDAPCRFLLPFICYTDLLQGPKQQVFAPFDFELLSSVDEQSQISMLSARNPFAGSIPVSDTKDYIFVKHEKMWIEAQNHCRAEYSDLVSIQSLEENALVAQVLQSDSPAWIGLFNRHQSEYSWMWANGDEFNFSNWDHFYPMDFTTMSVCVIMLNGRWKDVPCDFKFPFVCYVG
ncbi:macrophage mannose receptor 1-like [Pristis pectinata]|uniref:macrophage mannose receptor 1-like n=1 Tax=Pristis pectinata TaxID=685728 RepID=UPI00223D9A74|nr:macrophage mannose receptor 1-like [Pristis pectinata]